MAGWISIILWFLAIVQGGFFCNSYGIAFMILFLANLYYTMKKCEKKQKEFKNISHITTLFALFGICVCYIVSMLYHHTTEKSMERIIYMLFIFEAYLCIHKMNGEDLTKIQKHIIYISVFQVPICILDYLGLSIPGTLINARFMGSLQYPESVSLATNYFLQPHIIPALIRCFPGLVFSPVR